MGGKRRLLFNTGLLTCSSLAIRAAGMLFQAWLASHIGPEGIGLYQLTGSVTVLFSVFAVSGVRFAATRLISEEAARKDGGDIGGAVRRCLLYALLFGTVSAGMLWHYAETLGFLWVGDARVVLSLRIAALSLPLIALSAVFGGYFTANGRVWKAVAVQLLAVGAGISLTVTFLSRCDLRDLEQSCSAVTAGNALSELLGLIMLSLCYLAEGHSRQTPTRHSSGMTKRLLSTALPMALSADTRAGLNTLEHTLIPKCLMLAGLSRESALSGYGVVHGMALTTVLFPACLLFSMAELIVPELTLAEARGQFVRIRRMVRLVRVCTLAYALLTAVAVFLLSDRIAGHVFHTPGCAHDIRLLAPLMPIMNLDTITDGCLRGLGQQRRVMAINLLDAALGVGLVLLLLPHCGLKGYLLMIWMTESINCLLSSLALKKTLRAKTASG